MVIPKRSNPVSTWKFISFEREAMTMLNLHTLNSTLNGYATSKHTHITRSIYTSIHFLSTSQSTNQTISNGFASISSSHAYTHTSLFTKNKEASNAHTHSLM